MRLLPKAEWLVFLALFLSGFAAIVNETVWQRATEGLLGGLREREFDDYCNGVYVGARRRLDLHGARRPSD